MEECGGPICLVRLVPVRRFPSPSRSIRFGDVSEANGRETASHFRMDHVTRNTLAARKKEALGTRQRSNDLLNHGLGKTSFIITELLAFSLKMGKFRYGSLSVFFQNSHRPQENYCMGFLSNSFKMLKGYLYIEL